MSHSYPSDISRETCSQAGLMPGMTSGLSKWQKSRHSSYLYPLSRFLSNICNTRDYRRCPVFGSWVGAVGALHKNCCLCLVRCWRWSWPAGDELRSRGIGELARGVAGWWVSVVPPGGLQRGRPPPV